MDKEHEKELLDFLDKLGKVISEMFGPNCEVCISDLDYPDKAVISIHNGHVTGRDIGSPLNEESKYRIEQAKEGTYINYKKVLKKNSKLLKSSTIVKKIGSKTLSFCINYDCTKLEKLHYYLDQFLSMEEEEDDLEIFELVTPLPINDIIQESLKLIKKPVQEYTKEDRIAVISDLLSKGVLQIQKSVPKIAKALGVSRYTVYNYINELRETSKSKEEKEESV
ncbi:YheO-like domain-containing protein [Tepidanaerobacter acetatoxydans Re1]|uniref:YheO-like domain-containing protein n=1 Tax=Tepidanaerobacter acetatoxydans (strain DSM 21804 / JCM 16047 / Re1) TaxID=1209989 RepID=F4LS14_TEPAE|nr:helix-turn-helix transcriptional regulator [Tepidanaerobacter acetatoxydans]AEE92353.1 YheO-like domain-containing protein [Tepidanaerobacter acetatoxydans Re1]CDI40977.1 YheO-like domain-containing protein [Tepidanaerobacter acetatoxydans Re1]